jgi:hypothetical protein
MRHLFLVEAKLCEKVTIFSIGSETGIFSLVLLGSETLEIISETKAKKQSETKRNRKISNINNK